MMIFLQFVGRTPANPLRTLSYFAPQSEAAEVKWIEIVKKKNDLRLITEEGYLNWHQIDLLIRRLVTMYLRQFHFCHLNTYKQLVNLSSDLTI